MSKNTNGKRSSGLAASASYQYKSNAMPSTASKQLNRRDEFAQDIREIFLLEPDSYDNVSPQLLVELYRLGCKWTVFPNGTDYKFAPGGAPAFTPFLSLFREAICPLTHLNITFTLLLAWDQDIPAAEVLKFIEAGGGTAAMGQVLYNDLLQEGLIDPEAANVIAQFEQLLISIPTQ